MKLTYRWLKSEINRIGEEGGRSEEEVYVPPLSAEVDADEEAKRTLDQSYRFIPRSQDSPRRSSHRRDGSRKDQTRLFSRRFCKVSSLCLQCKSTKLTFRSSVVEQVLTEAWDDMRDIDPEASFSVVVVDSRPLNEGQSSALFSTSLIQVFARTDNQDSVS